MVPIPWIVGFILPVMVALLQRSVEGDKTAENDDDDDHDDDGDHGPGSLGWNDNLIINMW